MSKFKQLINPHSHTHYSLDGAATVEDIIKRNKELGATYTAVTEHGNMNSSLELYEKATKAKVKPIVGIELYVQPPFMDEIEKIVTIEVDMEKKYKDAKDRQTKIEKALKNEYVHLTVHFRDEWAYLYFCNLTPKMEERAVVKWGERKPIATLEEIAGASGHITICSGCLIGMTQKFFLPRKKSGITRPDLGEKAYLLIREIAGKDNFFVEVFPHEVDHEWKRPDKGQPGKFIKHECTEYAPDGDLQKPGNRFVMDLAAKYNDPIIVSLDSHFAVPEQKLVQDARLGNGDENWKFYTSYHITDSEEAYVHLQRQLGIDRKTMEQWIDNSYLFGSRFDNFKMTTSKDRWILQPLPDSWQSKLIDYIKFFGRMDWNNPVMMERLKYEIDVLSNNGKLNLMSYLFTVTDIAEFCRNNDVLMNVRGSAGGSLLLYLLGVSGVNPLKHHLSFERFLTVGRIKANTLPDVDMDVSDQEKVFNYLEEKYGDNFCRISVDTQLKIKSSIKDAERAILGKVRPETEKLCKTIKAASGITDSEYVFGYEDKDTGAHVPGLIETHEGLKSYAASNPEIWDSVTEMLGIVRQKSQHPCGVIITDKPVQDYIPVTKVSQTKVTGFNPKQVESAGGVKYDLLGLNTLRDMQAAKKLVLQRHGIDLNLFDLPSEPLCYEEFGLGHTAAVFQFDTDTVRPYLIATKPKTLDDLSNITSLCRPGTLDAPENELPNARTLSEVYVARSQGEPTQYVHPELEPILKDSYGIALYQEQTIRIFRDLAGYTAEEGEAVRRGIGKKDKAVLEKCTGDLRTRCMERGWTHEQVDLLIKQIMASAKYSFNQSHGTSYAYVAYACMYLKTFYPLEWWTAILSNASKDDLREYWFNMDKHIRLPNINLSKDTFVIQNDGGQDFIQAPINLIDGVGQSITHEITSKAPFASLEDFVTRIDRRIVNKRIIARLIFSGTMDVLFQPGMNEAEKLDLYFTLKAQVDGNPKEPVPVEYLTFTPLKHFLFKKSIFKVFNTDLTPMALPVMEERGIIRKSYSVMTYVDPNRKKLHGAPLINTKRYLDYIEETQTDITFAMVCYVVETEEKTYGKEGEEKTMMRLTLETDNVIINSVKFPDWGDVHHGIKKDIEGSVALVIFRKAAGRNDTMVQKILPIEKIEF